MSVRWRERGAGEGLARGEGGREGEREKEERREDRRGNALLPLCSKRTQNTLILIREADLPFS